MCRQEIERRGYSSPVRPPACGALADQEPQNIAGKLSLATVDRAKLDVMLGEGTELFSWPGGRRFDTGDPDDLLAGGFSGSGDFASFVLSVFTVYQVNFKYLGACDGAPCARFGYDVPSAVSRYAVKSPSAETTLGYHGTFDVDPQSASLLRMTVIPTDLPAALPGTCEIRTRMVCTRTAMDAGEFTIPASTKKSSSPGTARTS